ncbi:MAG: tetratricopeptide repeat protein [Planctomycetes bacterium]|nr:tetratricopeptide repeat protein [Planctomycetota bacterium]
MISKLIAPLWLIPVLFLTQVALGGAASKASEQSDDLSAYFSANGFANRGLYELAVPEYKKFLESHSDHHKAAMARYGLSVCLYRLKQYDDAIEHLARLVDESDFAMAAEVACMRGQCHLARNRFEQAVVDFDRVVEQHRRHALADDAAAGAIEANYALGRYDQAIKGARRFASRWPDSPLRERATYFWSLSAIGKEDYATAIKHLEELLKANASSAFAQQASLLLAQCYQHERLIDKAARVYTSIVERGNSSTVSDAMFGLGRVALEQGKPQQAVRWFDRIIDGSAEKAQAESVLFYRARASFDLAEYEKAWGLFDRFSQTSQDKSMADDSAYWMAKCELRLGRLADATKRLTRAILQFSDSELLGNMRYDLAISLVRTGDREQGVDALQAFCDQHAQHEMMPDALYLLAATQHQRGRFDESARHAHAFLERFSDHSLARSVEFLAAENELLSGRYKAAAGAYQRFLTRYRDGEEAVRARYRLGHALWQLGQSDKAEEALRAVLRRIQSEKRFHYGRFILGDISFQRSEWKTAQEHLSAYLEPGLDVPAADDAMLKLGLSLQRLNRSDEALQAFHRLVERFPESPHRLQAIFEGGQAMLASDRLDEAEAAFRRVLESGGESRFKPHALNHLATLAIKRQDFDAAARLYGEVGGALGDDDEAESSFDRARALLAGGRLDDARQAFELWNEKNPRHALTSAAAAQLAIVYARQERCEEALRTFKRFDKNKSAKVDERLATSAMYEKAWCLRKIGRVDDAMTTYQRLVANGLKNETHLHALLDMAMIKTEASQFEEAAVLLTRLRATNDGGKFSLPAQLRELGTYHLAMCKYEMDQPAEAVELFEEFISLFDDSSLIPSASFYCGEILFKSGRIDRAIEHMTRVVERFPDDPAYGPSLLRLGECLAAAQYWPRSEQVFRDYLAKFGDSEHWFQAQFGIGWAVENQSRFDEAISAYTKVVKRHKGPTAARAQFQIGECQFAKKDYKAAASELLKVDILYAYPEWSAAALFEAGRCFEKLSKQVEARAQFQAVTENYGDTRWAKMASQHLSELSASVLPGR